MPEKEKRKAEKERIVAAFATDSNYLYYTGVTLYTLLEHISSENLYHIVILSSHLSSEEQQFFQDLIQPYNASCAHVTWEYIDMEKSIDEIGKENFYLGNLSIATYYRLFLASLLGKEKKIIYLDSDLLLQCDIAELWQQDMKGNAVAAIPDIFSTRVPLTRRQIELYLHCKNDLQLKNSSFYFNAGVLILDLAKLREMDFLSMVKKEIRTGMNFTYYDQDIFNKIFERKSTRLASKWNYVPLRKKIPLSKVKIIHLAGHRPWESANKPFASLWHQEAQKLSWYPLLLQKSSKAHINYLEEIEKQYCSILNSSCWKLTYPLRASMIFAAEFIRTFKMVFKYIFTKK